MLLHNFIVDEREAGDSEDRRFFSNFDIAMDRSQRTVSRKSGELPRALVTDNNEPKTVGRNTLEENEPKKQGEEVRHRLVVKLAAHGRRRPMQWDMECNDCGNTCTTA